MAAGALAPVLYVGGPAVSEAADDQGQRPADSLGISETNAAIHQEVVFKAPPERVYRVLVDAREFAKVVVFSGAVQAMALDSAPVRISSEAGGEFALFGGYITGRHIEMTPGVRLIQAWRAASWQPHVFSIVRFELSPDPDGAKLVFDHTGFPNAEAAVLASGWRKHYWTPMAKVLA